MFRLAIGSTLLVGSSRMTSLEPPIKEKATHSLRCNPPDRWQACSSLICARFICFSIFSTSSSTSSADISPLRLPKKIRCSFTVIFA
uniref:Uncharacterized protein n=1 Tax=Ixodes ricinus TaxID=34613 RepID=A0A6B0TZE7_IXORI